MVGRKLGWFALSAGRSRGGEVRQLARHPYGGRIGKVWGTSLLQRDGVALVVQYGGALGILRTCMGRTHRVQPAFRFPQAD